MYIHIHSGAPDPHILPLRPSRRHVHVRLALPRLWYPLRVPPTCPQLRPKGGKKMSRMTLHRSQYPRHTSRLAATRAPSRLPSFKQPWNSTTAFILFQHRPNLETTILPQRPKKTSLGPYLDIPIPLLSTQSDKKFLPPSL